ATTISGWLAKKRAAIWASLRRTFASRMTAAGASKRAASGASTAAAPRATASGMNCVPSVAVPGTAAKRYPGATLRLSSVSPVISIPDHSGGAFRPARRARVMTIASVPPGGRPLLLGLFLHELLALLRRELRLDVEQGGDPLDDLAAGGDSVPARGGEAVGALDRL